MDHQAYEYLPKPDKLDPEYALKIHDQYYSRKSQPKSAGNDCARPTCRIKASASASQ